MKLYFVVHEIAYNFFEILNSIYLSSNCTVRGTHNVCSVRNFICHKGRVVSWVELSRGSSLLNFLIKTHFVTMCITGQMIEFLLEFEPYRLLQSLVINLWPIPFSLIDFILVTKYLLAYRADCKEQPHVNPNSLDNKGSCWILKDFYCSVQCLGS